MLSLKRWEERTYEAVGIHMKLRRLRRDEAKPLTKAILKVFGEMEKGRDKDLTTTQRGEIMAAVFEQVEDADLRTWFSTCVKDVEGFEIDGQPITTGTALLEQADDSLLLWLLLELHGLSKLSVAEGKGSASPSPSQPELIPNGGSPALSIEREAGTEPSDVRDQTTEPQSIPVGV